MAKAHPNTRLGSLRTKFLSLLLLITLASLSLAALLGNYALNSLRDELGLAYARDVTLLKRAQVLEPISRDLALSIRMSDSELIREWLKDETNPSKHAAAMREMEGYRRQFISHEAFVISNRSRHYYFNHARQPFSDQPRYTIDPTDPDNLWFTPTMQMSGVYNTNVSFDTRLKRTNVWMNVLMRDGEERLGLVGTGVDLTNFLATFIDVADAGVTPIVVNEHAAILAHPNRALISEHSATQKVDFARTLPALADAEADREIMQQLLAQAQAKPGSAPVRALNLDGKKRLLSACYVPDLKWYVLSAVDLSLIQVLSWRDWIGFAMALGALLIAAVISFALALNQWVVRPLTALTTAAETIAAGRYEAELPSAGADEIGALTTAFSSMRRKVQSHTSELEATVNARTAELRASHRDVLAANEKLGDAISYASRIQDAILPHRELERLFGQGMYVLWRPRDVVGGDFYFVHQHADGVLIGLVDCAGHSVPGALMTMLARAAFDSAIRKSDLRDPAAVLTAADEAVRAMLHVNDRARGAATTMDAALVFLLRERPVLQFAGAKIDLHCRHARQLLHRKGGRRALADRKQGTYETHELAFDADTLCVLATDGVLDQNGASDRNGFGAERLLSWLSGLDGIDLSAKGADLEARLAEYQAGAPQRDDMSLLCFRPAAWRERA